MVNSKCNLELQGFKRGACKTIASTGSGRACEITLRKTEKRLERLIKSAHLSRPEHYYSIYQSGCNWSCLKCHSWEFTQIANGQWYTIEKLAEEIFSYAEKTTFKEPRHRATAWHAHDLCRGCGSCIIHGKRSDFCPGVLDEERIILSPQGFGPARNIAAFTGGDLACRPEYYCEVSKNVKKELSDFWMLIETNGYGLTPKNLEAFQSAEIDSFWLDIKAYDPKVHKKLTGISNERILELPATILDMGFVLEVLSLLIPGWVDVDQIKKIAEILKEVDPEIPFCILAFFPIYKMSNVRSPIIHEMIEAFISAKQVGLKNIRLGNVGVFAKSREDFQLLNTLIGPNNY